ncbi:glucosaminidase domain-containing protein [Tenuifilum thalassicum]|uniref:Peptidoglycan hydrolase n=1 Tax=Tenuifilum thalassicum TaxID=2590900 RepID=A0A7D4AXY4_9BACT|nr:glucosaminidase domain-containing protein [Tenuifilum thalassicum]QKG80574.1 LysM peptidoglycan-binding domain-containing protein [Tenuifilum thalassicum]
MVRLIRSLGIFLLLTGFFTAALAQKKISREEYISRYSYIAIQNMKKYGVPASITLAQALLESDNGNSTLAVKANNHFGIKCHKNWKGGRIYHDDDRKGECFRKYRSPEQSFTDHSLFLRGSSRYDFLFKLDPTDYKAWARGLKKAGYATNPNYANLLIQIIEDNQLYRFDKGVDVKVSPPSDYLADVDSYSVDIYNSRKVFVRNRIKYIVVKEGDTFESLTKDLSLMPWQLYKYNDLTKDSTLREGQELYIQPKRRRADRSHPVHTVEPGETMYSISQRFGVKLKHLYRKNRMKQGEEPEVGDVIYLRRKKPL